MSRFLRRVPESVDETIGKDTNLIDAKVIDSASSTPPAISHDTITFPSSSCIVPAAPQFSPDQRKILLEIKNYLLDSHKTLESQDASYLPWEKRWIEDPSTAKRYANAVKWDLTQAKKRAYETLIWRREFKPDLLVPDEVKKEGESGKHIISGFDYKARPVLYLRPGRENTKPNAQQVRYLVWSLERAIDHCPDGQDKICLLIDYTQATRRTEASFSIQKMVLHILQSHYPERLGMAIVCNVPWILSSFFTLISPFLDPVTRTKIAMLRSPEHVKDYIPLDMLDNDFGGQWKYEFNFERYWNTLIDFCGIAPDGTRTHESKARQGVRGLHDASTQDSHRDDL